MISRPLFVKELKEAKWKTITGLLITGITGASLPFLVDYLGFLIKQMAVPEWARSVLGEQLGNYPLYLWSNWYGKNLLQFSLAFAVVMAGPLIAGERSRNTLEFLASKPLSRVQIILTKAAAGAVSLGVIILASTVITLVASYVAGRPVPVVWFMSGFFAQYAGALVFFNLALLLSTRSDDGLKAAVIAGGIALLMFAAEWVAPLRGRTIIWMMAASRSFITGEVSFGHIFFMLLLASGFLWAALSAFRQSDV